MNAKITICKNYALVIFYQIIVNIIVFLYIERNQTRVK